MTNIPYKFFKVADITNVADSEKVAGAIFFDDATETVHIYGAGNNLKIYGSRKWVWSGLNYSTFVKEVAVGDVIIWSASEHQLVARKDVSLANTAKVMLMANTGFNTLTFTTSNGGNTWSLTSSILEDFSDFIPNSDASVNPTANSVVKRDNNGDVRVHGIVDDTGNMYALPYSSEEVKDNADAMLQMEITDLNTIRNNAKTAAEAIPDLEGDIEQLFGSKQDVIADLDEIREGASAGSISLPATLDYSEYTFTEKVTPEVKNDSATIRSIKGNTVVWNQRVHNAISPNNDGVDGWYVRQGINNATIQNDKITIYFNSGVSSVPWISQNVGLVSGHKYIAKLSYEYNQDLLNDNPNLFLEFCMTPSIINNSRPRIWSNYSDRTQTKGDAFLFFDGVEGNPWIVFNFINLNTNYLDLGYSATFSAKITDLTQMFGAGNEPTTVEEFYAMVGTKELPAEYNEGEFVGFKGTTLKSVGANLVNPNEVEYGRILSDGSVQVVSNYVNSYIEVAPNHTYYLWNVAASTDSRTCAFYDIEGVFIKSGSFSSSYAKSGYVTTPENAHYMRVVTYVKEKDAFAVYKCDENGETDYEGQFVKYAEDSVSIGNDKDLFPDGMLAIHNDYKHSFDELFIKDNIKKTIKRLVIIDLGTLNWSSTSIANVWAALRSTYGVVANSNALILSNEYVFVDGNTVDADLLDKQFKISAEAYGFRFKDTSCSTKEEFKAKISGVKIICELETPIETDLGPVDLFYSAQLGGTEKFISDSITAPATVEIAYNYDAISNIESLKQVIENKSVKANGTYPSMSVGSYVSPSMLQGEKRTGNVNTGGGITASPTTFHYLYDVRNFPKNTEIHISVQANSQYSSLWTLWEEPYDPSVGFTTFVAKGPLCSESQQAIIKLADYPEAQYLYVIIGAENNVTEVYYEVNDSIYESFEEAKTRMVNVTYDELVTLRDNGDLKAGMQYRITDYVTTTVQESTSSAGHQFDIIVTADDEKTLNDVARACLHEGDTYFSGVGAKLEAWQIWYCLDNDINRFAWAEEEDGKGVIYRMIDEWNNDCPYDFKNIMFYRESLPENIDIPGFKNDEYYYTFTWIDSNGNITDLTLTGQTLLNDESCCSGVYDNKIGNCSAFAIYLDGKTEPFLLALSNNVFISTYEYDGGTFYGCYGNVLSINCYSNTFGNTCEYNTFGKDCYRNTFGDDCNGNTFGNYCFDNTFNCCCYSNTFENGCNSNTFEDGCNSNMFKNDCYNNIFMTGCYNNTFGNSCFDITFGTDCYYNTFGEGCYNNIFENDCHHNELKNSSVDNTFGAGCYNNTFGAGCYNNTFGNDCYNNTFGNGCFDISVGSENYHNSFGLNCYAIYLGDVVSSCSFGNSCHDFCIVDAQDYEQPSNSISCIRVEEGCCNLILESGDASVLGDISNYTVVKGTTDIRGIRVFRGRQYETKIARNSKGEIKEYCEADLIA